MSIEDDIAFLERVPALRLLGRDALRILAIGSENRYIHEGISLFGEGEDADGAYVVQEGSFDLVSEKSAMRAERRRTGHADRRACAAHRNQAAGRGDRARAVERGAHSAPAFSENARRLSGRGACACATRLRRASIRPRANSPACARAGGRAGAKVTTVRRAAIEAALRHLAPKIPPHEFGAVVDHALDSEGLSTAAPESAAWLSLVAYVRHVFTEYDELLGARLRSRQRAPFRRGGDGGGAAANGACGAKLGEDD